ncbi:MAG: hypothetical protein IJX16_06605 [Clostridia bacterium]|nr:hypothetical protein [Clostridia bacterium]
MSNLNFYRNQYQEAVVDYELIKAGAEVLLCKMVQSGEIDTDKVMEIGKAIENAKSSVSYRERDLKKAEAEEGGNENA